jgi:hypothetical protein
LKNRKWGIGKTGYQGAGEQDNRISGDRRQHDNTEKIRHRLTPIYTVFSILEK